MKVCGIITEYNPFHNGHQYHLDESRSVSQADIIVNVMSGNFVQRGEPAIVDKFTRAHQAILSGCDIVIELPTIYATQAATKFAKGAIELLKLAQVNEIVFGSESNDVSLLEKYAHEEVVLDPKQSCNHTYQHARKGCKSNDILGINYIKALEGSTIKATTIQRTNQYQDETLQAIASATAIRNQIFSGLDYQIATPMQGLKTTHQMKDYYPYLRLLLLSLSTPYLQSIFLMDEGIEAHLRKCARNQLEYDGFLQLAITKKYTKSRIQRTLIQLLLQVERTKVTTLEQVSFLRILAFNDNGRHYLKHLKEQGVKVVTNWKDLPLYYQEFELKATTMYYSVEEPRLQQAKIHREVCPAIYVKEQR